MGPRLWTQAAPPHPHPTTKMAIPQLVKIRYFHLWRGAHC